MIEGEARKAWYSRDGLEVSTDYEDVSDQVIDNQYCCQVYKNDSETTMADACNAEED